MAGLDDLWFFLAGYGAALLVAPFLWKQFGRDRQLARTADPPPAVANFLGWHLRTFGNAVKESDGWFTVELARYGAVRVRVKPEGEGSTILWRPWLTVRGWGTLVWTMVLGLAFPLIAAWIAHASSKRARSFLESGISPRIAVDGHVAPPPDEVRFLLLRSLSDAWRFARSAHESTVLRYADLKAIAAFLALLLWLAFVLADIASRFPNPPDAGVVWPATAVSAGLGTAAWLFVRWRTVPKVRRLAEWEGRLKAATLQVLGDPSDAPDQASFVEILASAAEHIPAWQQDVTRARWQRDPVSYWAVFMLGYTAAAGLLAAPLAAGTLGAPVAALYAASSGALMGAAWWVARRSKKRDESERSEQARLWRARRTQLDERFDTLLGGTE